MPAIDARLSLEKPGGGKFWMEEEFYVDTGFTVDFKMPQSVGSRLERRGFKGSTHSIKTAIGTANGRFFQAVTVGIILNGTNVLTSPQRCSILCIGEDDTPNVVGLKALGHFKTCVDMRRQILSVEQGGNA